MINEKQEIIIKNSIAPAAVIAGPGTGKTFTIVEKVIELIKNDNIDPNRILLTTFTKKASYELIERIQTRLKKENLQLDTSNMMIGNFHSLALNFLRKNKTFHKKIFSSRVIDSYTEGYLIEKNLHLYKRIENFDLFIKYNHANMIREIFEDITNNLIDLDMLKNSKDPRDNLAYKIYKTHENFLEENNLINYQMILKQFYDLLKDPTYGDKIRGEIDYVIIDEYQDTNHIQQEIGFMLVREKNILVFGDDDQSLYAFRGADPNNLLDFDKICRKKLKSPAKYYYLDINYRSNQAIIDMSKARLNKEDIRDEKFDKKLSSVDRVSNQNSIVRARSNNMANLLNIINILKKDMNLNQIAFLFPSLNSSYPKDLQKFLEENSIDVLNKKSGMFFYREEIRLLMYILLNIFSKKPLQKTGSAKSRFLRERQTLFKTYIVEIFEDVYFISDEKLKLFIEEERENLEENRSFSTIIYRALELEKFREILSQDLESLDQIRSQSNLGKFIRLVTDYENLYQDIEINYKNQAVDFLYAYLFYFFKTNAIDELEDFDAPKDAINFMTIHQAKGLEFDVVFVSGLFDYPRDNRKSFLEKYQRTKPDPQAKFRDFYRKYFTAFTRSKKLCVILDNSRDMRLQDFQKNLPSSSNISSLAIQREEKREEKKILAYTTDISIYESCPLKYKFLRILGFTSPQNRSLIFGSRVHELVEYLALLKKEGENFEKIGDFLKENPSYIAPVNNFLAKDFKVQESEANFKSDRDFYILQGNVDILLEDGSIIDVKTGKFKEDFLGGYKKQVLCYYRLMSLNYRQVPHLYLYYIEEDRLLEVEKEEFDIEVIDEISKKILNDKSYEKTTDLKQCAFCSMKYFCGRT